MIEGFWPHVSASFKNGMKTTKKSLFSICIHGKFVRIVLKWVNEDRERKYIKGYNKGKINAFWGSFKDVKRWKIIVIFMLLKKEINCVKKCMRVEITNIKGKRYIISKIFIECSLRVFTDLSVF